jgi:hypothetical protein
VGACGDGGATTVSGGASVRHGSAAAAGERGGNGDRRRVRFSEASVVAA